MATRNDFTTWVYQALTELGGTATTLEVSRHIWETRRADLEASGDLLYSWQYDIRWAAMRLRKADVLLASDESGRGIWTLNPQRPVRDPKLY